MLKLTIKKDGATKKMESVINSHIEITPNICGGKPRIKGHTIKVQDIVIWHERMGLSPDEIIYYYPIITLSDVYAALTYYQDHREEIRQQIEEGETSPQQLQENKSLSLVKTIKKRLPLFGSDKDIISISDDFDEPLSDFNDYQ